MAKRADELKIGDIVVPNRSDDCCLWVVSIEKHPNRISVVFDSGGAIKPQGTFNHGTLLCVFEDAEA